MAVYLPFLFFFLPLELPEFEAELLEELPEPLPLFDPEPESEPEPDPLPLLLSEPEISCPDPLSSLSLSNLIESNMGYVRFKFFLMWACLPDIVFMLALKIQIALMQLN